MSKPIIQIENLGKKYRLGETISHKNIRESITSFTRKIVTFDFLRDRKQKSKKCNEPQEIWALKDISMDVEEGEVVGIIGPNGAGKSTLLKVLSRITEPTTGKILLRGRVASLLEVGTGFHAELTGRENIFLNGAILGMKRQEILGKFDEIVEFSGLSKFVDTPVKRYSSGMYVRLAFAVAAHLEPEILIVDEVLAVGDAAFQKKCLGKMENVASKGRTVLFVSHNMQLITSLCQRAILLQQGGMALDSDVMTTVREYMSSSAKEDGIVNWDSDTAPGDENCRLLSIKTIDSQGSITQYFRSAEKIKIEFELYIETVSSSLVVGFDLCSAEGIPIFRCYHNDTAERDWPELKKGHNRIFCEIPADFLNAGTYVIAPRISLHCIRWIVKLDSALLLNVELTHGKSPFWAVLGSKRRPGMVAPIIKWFSE